MQKHFNSRPNNAIYNLGRYIPIIYSQCNLVLEAMYLKENISAVQNGVTDQQAKCIDILMSSSHAANSKQAFKCTCGHKRSHDSNIMVMIPFLCKWNCLVHTSYIYILE
jgi:hypothetical protein